MGGEGRVRLPKRERESTVLNNIHNNFPVNIGTQAYIQRERERERERETAKNLNQIMTR